MRSPLTWFVILSAACIVGPRVLGARPQTPREWWYVRVVLAFLALMLPLMAALR
ncbi:MAG TPA: hypothetical protein VH497_18670 [Vicinamibacterales bacterium]